MCTHIYKYVCNRVYIYIYIYYMHVCALFSIGPSFYVEGTYLSNKSLTVPNLPRYPWPPAWRAACPGVPPPSP